MHTTTKGMSSMFRFWTSDSRGSEKTSEANHPSANILDLGVSAATTLPAPSPKRRRLSSVDTTAYSSSYPPAKRAKTEQDGGLPSPISAAHSEAGASRKSSASLDIDAARDVIQYQFGLEILLKHDELRLINQELAKCQVALEQLRRCHLIPYPVQCPTPSQMLDISSGKGPALQTKPGKAVPKWAPPFGVVDGPYARHYARWLIPDPVFDGIQPETHGFLDASRTKSAVAEGRTTRNSMDVGAFGKQRSARGAGGHRLHSLSSGYPQPKDKQAPCVLKRSDGVTVKLVCIDCHRWDFSSTQGFINHCRIAHRRDFKSHEEAAVHCGHPIEVDESGGIVGEDNKTPSTVAPGLVHPLLRNEPTSEQEAYKAILSRIRASLDLYHAGKLPTVQSIPTATTAKSSEFVASSDTPYLSQLMQKKNLGGNLSAQVDDAKTKLDWDLLSPVDDSEPDQPSTSETASTPKPSSALPAARTPAVMRVPVRSAASPPPSASIPRPASSKSRVSTHLGISQTGTAVSSEIPETPPFEDDMDVDLSPNTMTSNNAPSLVSDDGEYDDSDDGSASDGSEDMDTDSVSDVAEINIDEDHDVRDVAPRPISHRAGSVNLKRDETRHVTFVTPIASNNTKGRRKPRV